MFWFKKKSLEDRLKITKVVSVAGVKFTIKKIDMIDYLNGSKVLLKIHDTYKLNKNVDNGVENIKKVKDHYRDVLMAGIIDPKMTRKENEEGFYIEKLLNHFDIVNKIYAEIVSFTYGKKKIKQLILQNLS